VYAESSINPQDLIFLPYALASEVQYWPTEKGYRIVTPYSIAMRLPPEHTSIQVDGTLLSSSRENLFLITAGDHEVVLGADPAGAFSTHALDTHILSMTGNILSVEYSLRGIDVRYASTTRALMSLNREPTTVSVDGVETACVVMKGNDCYSLFLPPGTHRVEIAAGDVFSYGVNLTSLWSTTAIALFGIAAVLALFLMYVSLKVFRRRIVAAGGGP
jgi:hypothetical protein